MDEQAKINYGQARINYELNKVDEEVIKTLQMFTDFLKQVKELPPLAHLLKDFDFSNIDAAIAKASDRSKKVADIKPPGCEPPTYPN